MNNQQSYQLSEGAGCLYLVPTPIGNLGDMTFRSVEVLKSVDLIAAEDTRHTQKLLNHFDITTKTLSFHEHNTQKRIPEIINLLQSGQSIAQVSDAGTPSISDPGAELVQATIESGIAVVPLPGANAAIPALIASGISPQPFYFHGFLPRSKKEMAETLESLNKKEETMILYESPHRLKMTLIEIQKVMGDERPITLAREITKHYEEFVRGTVKSVLSWTENHPIRGEFVIILGGNMNPPTNQENQVWLSWSHKEHVEKIMEDEQLSSKDAIKKVAKMRQLPKREIYAAFHEI